MAILDIKLVKEDAVDSIYRKSMLDSKQNYNLSSQANKEMFFSRYFK